jgi:hypothetical protein
MRKPATGIIASVTIRVRTETPAMMRRGDSVMGEDTRERPCGLWPSGGPDPEPILGKDRKLINNYSGSLC